MSWKRKNIEQANFKIRQARKDARSKTDSKKKTPGQQKSGWSTRDGGLRNQIDPFDPLGSQPGSGRSSSGMTGGFSKQKTETGAGEFKLEIE